MKRALVLAALALAAPAAAATKLVIQPADERRAQQSLPQSHAPLWAVLRRTRVIEDDRHGLFSAAFPPEVQALQGRTVALSGFMLPLDTQARAQHFLLSRYTPVCFFCPPGAPNEVVEVTTHAGVPLTDRMLTVSGRLRLTRASDKGLFFRLDDAIAR
ncbi:MAG: DUF3299 domain-containing protein [Caulobacteraceae bacterium]|nr:DUF3299 domain-containing protein [Caulobacter sp.]